MYHIMLSSFHDHQQPQHDHHQPDHDYQQPQLDHHQPDHDVDVLKGTPWQLLPYWLAGRLAVVLQGSIRSCPNNHHFQIILLLLLIDQEH